MEACLCHLTDGILPNPTAYCTAGHHLRGRVGPALFLLTRNWPPTTHTHTLGRGHLSPESPIMLTSDQEKMDNSVRGKRSPVGNTHGERTHLPGNRCPGPITQIAVSHPQNASPPINHSGEPVSFSCSDESDPCAGRKAKSTATLEQPHTSPQLTVKGLTQTTTAGTTPHLRSALPQALSTARALPFPLPGPALPRLLCPPIRAPFLPPFLDHPHSIRGASLIFKFL